jgi:dienelactone hydrolase
MRAVGCAVALLLAGCAAAGNGVVPPVPVAGARAALNPLPASLLLPDGPGPHAVVVLMHGCGGITPNTHNWANRLQGWGYGTLILDSFTPRAVTSVCAPDRQRLVTRFDRAGDAIAAVRWLQTQPGVDAARIAVIGESHGGSAAATLMNRPFATAAAGSIKAVVDFYGGCRDAQLYGGGAAFLALAGDADTWGNPAETCQSYRAALPQHSLFTVAIYKGAVHGFDNPRNVALRWEEGHPMQYDPDAAADAIKRVRAMLDQTIGPPG